MKVYILAMVSDGDVVIGAVRRTRYSIEKALERIVENGEDDVLTTSFNTDWRIFEEELP